MNTIKEKEVKETKNMAFTLYERYLAQAGQNKSYLESYHENEHDNSGGHPDYHNNSHDNTPGKMRIKKLIKNETN